MRTVDRIGQQLLQLALVAGVVAFAAYMLFCHKIGQLAQVSDQTGVTLAGRAVECQAIDAAGGRGVYRLQDPTGDTYVVTGRGVPAEKALVVIRGIKRTSNQHTVVVETHRLVGSF